MTAIVCIGNRGIRDKEYDKMDVSSFQETHLSALNGTIFVPLCCIMVKTFGLVAEGITFLYSHSIIRIPTSPYKKGKIDSKRCKIKCNKVYNVMPIKINYYKPKREKVNNNYMICVWNAVQAIVS